MYRSPIRLAGLEPGAGFDKQSLSLARKKMLAELELGDGHAAVINGTELNRQDIARLFDELANEQKLAYHVAIANDDVLLHFLETGEIHAFGPGWAENDLYDDPGFRHFVSPYFAAAMSVMFHKVVSGSAGSGMLTKFLRQRSFLSVADHDAAYGKITRYFLEIKNRILLCLHHIGNPPAADDIHRAATPGRVTKEEIEALCTDYDVFVLNQLPEEFDDLRYSIVDALNDICVTCDHMGNPALAYTAIAKAATVRCESLHELVQKNKALVYDKLQPRAYRTTTPQKEQPLRWVGFVVFLFITIARLAGSSSCNDHSSYSKSDNMQIYDLYHGSDGTSGENAITDMQTYHSLIAAFNGAMADSGISIGRSADSVIQLPHKEKNGVDVLSQAWKKLSLDPVDSMPETGGARSELLIANKSAWPAIMLYALNEQYFGSVYIRPHSSYTLHYSAANIHADVYSGNKWSESKTTDVRMHLGHKFSTVVTLKGGFEEHSAYIRSAENSLFYRSGGNGAVYADKIFIEDDAAYGTKFTNEYDVK